MPVIAIIDDYQGFSYQLDVVRKLKSELPQATIRVISEQPLSEMTLGLLVDVQYLVLIRERTKVTVELLNKMPALQAIVQTGRTSVGSVSPSAVLACQQRNITILEGGESDPYSTAELVWALMLIAERHLHLYLSSMDAGQWQQTPSKMKIGRALRGQTLGILGYGRIGQILAKFAEAFGMKVHVWGRESSRSMATKHGLHICASKQDLFATSDIVTLQLRLNEQTRHSVTENDLKIMKPGALLINSARAELIAPGALQKALSCGTPSMAAIDVHVDEPLLQTGRERPENLIATPHIGYVEHNSYEILFGAALQQLVKHHETYTSNATDDKLLGDTDEK